MKRTNSTDKNIKLTRRVVIMLAAVITALAVAITCALCIGNTPTRTASDNAEQGGVRTSTSYSPSSGTTYSATSIAAGDTLNYSYTGSVYSVTLPIGTYYLEVWGAQGASGYATSGGYGGYAKATYTITAATTLYICVGGMGGTSAGGYNGGGSTVYNRTCGHRGGGGGGATHIATNSANTLSSVSSSYVLIVGGGGGGGGGYSATNPGGNGGASGGSAVYSSSYTNTAGGGTTGGGGSCSAGSSPYSSLTTAGGSGSYGQGGNAPSVSSGAGGGGGGGGYYGGAAGYTSSSCYSAPGGGGCNYIKSGLTTISNTSQTSVTGNGKAVITVVSVNQLPTSRGASVTLNARSSGSTAIAASTIASDPEGTTVAYTAASSSNYDTLPSANAGLWVNGSTLATNYFDWTWASTTLTITNVKRYPRSGVDGSTADGKIVLSTYVRDSFGTATTRGVSKVSFTVTVPANSVSLRTGIVSGQSNVGASTIASTSPPVDPASASGIYNPNGTNRNTLFVKKSLVVGEAYTTITAASLLSGTTLSNSLDKAVISINSTASISGADRKYKIREVDNNTNKVTAYLANKTVIANAYDQLTIECLSPDPNYQVLPITIYTVEQTTAFGTSYPNVVPGIGAISLEIVFKMGNIRPVLKSDVSNLVNVTAGASQTLSLNTYFSDADTPTISSSTHTITGVTVPANEFVLIDRQQKVVAATNYNVGYTAGTTVSGDVFTTTATGSTATGFNANIAYNATSPVSGTVREQAFMSFTYANDTITVTGLRASYSQYTSTRQLTALGHFYLLLHISDKRETDDNGIWLPLAFTVGSTNTTSHTPVATVTTPNSVTGQTAVSTFPTADGAVGDSFYFAPMAINYGGSHVVGQYKAADANGNNTGALTDSGLQPLAIDGDNFSTANGLATWGGGQKLNELLRLTTSPEQIVKSVSEVGVTNSNGVWENRYIKAETIPIYIAKSNFVTAAYSGGRVVVGSGTNANGYYFVSLTADGDYYIVNGLKITLKSATMNRYVYATAGVIDVTDNPVATINIAIRVKNTPLQTYTADSGNIAKFGNPERDSAYSTYSYSGSDTPTFTYKIPLNGTVIVTPYDLAYDYNMSVDGVNGVNGGFTLNGYSGRYNSSTGMFTAGSDAAADGNKQFTGLFANSYNEPADTFLGSLKTTTLVKKVSNTTSGTPSNSAINANQNMPCDRLFFERTTGGSDAYTYNPTTFNNVSVGIANATNFVDVNFGTKVKVGGTEYAVDFMMITAVNRTTQPAVFDLVVRDRYGSSSSDGSSSFTMRIVIEVVNTKPTVKNPAYYKELSVKPVTSGQTVVTPDTAVLYANGNGTETGLMQDHDNDIPEYMMARGIAVVNKSFIDGYNANTLTTAEGTAIDNLTFSTFDGLADKYTTNGSLPLTNYVTAEISSRRELSVSAVSSTKAIAGGVYVVFFVTDNNGGNSLGYVQIEVINTVPVLNEAEENGFDAQNPMWNIESTSDGDIMRRRYIVGSQAAAESLKTDKAALDIDIKLIAVDEDGLHNKVVLSQCTNTATEGSPAVYNYINKSTENTTENPRVAFEAAVPSIGRDASVFNGTASAVKVFKRVGTSTAILNAADGFNTELNFLISGTWYTRAQLIDALVDGTVSSDTCFDGSGRFIVADWALLLHATKGFESNEDVGIRFSLRDQAELGGDTAGIATAYNSNRTAGNVVVNGRLLTTVYEHISKTGIRSISEYLGQNNDYYTVEHTDTTTNPATSTRYISTYDGNTDDGTLANKATSGAVYTSASGTVAGAFKYSDTIEVPSATASGHTASGENVTYQTVYVPMSYFGLRSALVGAKTDEPNKGSVVYYTDEYVGYELAKNTAVDLNNINQILACMTLSDGTYEWKGTDIKNNPYITIGAFDWYHDSDSDTNSAWLANDRYSSPYYNNRLAVVTKDNENTSIGYEQYTPNTSSIVGEGGTLLYLEEQATKLIEHNFGLTFTKKNVRTSTRSLSFTINLARYKGNMVALDNKGEIAKEDRRTVELKIHVENSKLDLYNADDNSSPVKYDTEQGTYYMDLRLKSSESAAYTLSRKAVGQNPSSDAHTIEYYDDDYGTADKRDYAYFSGDSFMQLSQWQVGAAGYNRAMTLTDDDEPMFANVLATSDKAQNSVANYFGANEYDNSTDFVAALNDSDKAYKKGTFQANGGIYGVAGKDGYSSYFNASLTNNNTRLNIMPVRKTFINEIAFSNVNDLKSVDTTSQAEVAAAYKKRGLVALYDNASVDPLEPSRVYYPFKVLIYDSFGLGFNDASYVAIEFRITIVNGDPSLKVVGDTVTENGTVIGRQYAMNLAVGNSATINLYDIVYDPDIYTYTQSNLGRLSTKAYFEKNSTGVVCETGDYLDSPLNHDEYKTTAYNPDVQKEGEVYYYNGGGFVSTESAAYNDRDVVMSMDVDSNGDPLYNTIMFKVNRRTTAAYNGSSVSVDRYKFTLKFYDGTGAVTQPFTFIINITNQTPTVTQVNRSFTMRAGDDMTILTSYYDVFTGADDDRTAAAYRNSDTYTMLTERQNRSGYGTSWGDGSNNDVGNGRYWKFADITTAAAGGTHITYDSTLDRGTDSSTVHLGYIGLANDDTPWRLRFTDWTKTNNRIAVYSESMISLRPEGAATGASSQLLALRIIARSACSNEPVTVKIEDSEGGIITCTLYITIVSSPPIALDCSNDSENVSITGIGLEGLYNPNGSVNIGTYATYIVPAAGTHTFNVSGVGERTARRVTTVKMSNVARDPDGDNETQNMRLYGNGEFIVNNQPLVSDIDGIYRTEYFEIKPSNDGLSFTITATGYNPDTTIGYEELKFRIADYGDSAYSKTLQITIRIYTLYSDMINEAAATATGNAYTNYLKGSDGVNVKSYDVYYNPAQPADKSKYAFIKLTGNDGNDNNTNSPIVDPDATVSGDASYDVRLYAFINVQDDGTVKALSADDINDMLERNGTRKTFRLKPDENYSDYLIGGRLADGTVVSVTNTANVRLNAILDYASFEFAADGASLQLTPKASTLNSPEFILYVEATKPLGDRAFSRTDAVLSAGALFRLNVIDSAPQAVDGRHEVDGVKGTVGKFTVFNPEDRYGALFMDSDAGDKVTVHGIVNNKLADAEYANVMSQAVTEMRGLDWQADSATGKPRAFDISVNNSGELEVKINRRIDYVVDGVYQPFVTIPLRITGEDSVGERVTTTVYLTIHNSDIGTVDSLTSIDSQTMVGYMFGRDDDDELVMNVQLRHGTPLTVNLSDIITDNDTESAYDADSYRFVLPDSQGGYTYLTDEEIEVKWYALDSEGRPNLDNTRTLATATPLGEDSLHRTGILFNAVATERDLTATVYVRIIDRSSDALLSEKGVIIKINVIVMNDAPFTIEGKENTTLYMIGAETGEPAGMLFFIGDFVADRNDSDVVGDDESAQNIDTCLRIARQEAREVDKIYSQKYDSIPDSFGLTDLVLSSALFEVTIPPIIDDALMRDYCKRMGKDYGFKDNTNLYNQWFVVKPRTGFYGSGAIDITVVDGNANVKYDTLSTTFCLQVHVISNPNEVIDNLTNIELACSKTKQIDIRSLMPDLPNNLSLEEISGDVEEGDKASVFSQYEYYEIVGIGFQNEIDNSKATFTKLDESGQLWELKASNQVTRDPVRVEVTFALKNDPNVTYKKYFYLNVIANRSPQIKYTEILFKRPTSDGEIDDLRDLNEANSIRLQAWQLFEDLDDPEGAAIRFLDVKSQVSSLVKAKLVKDENGEYKYLELNFVARGESEITVTVTDETGSPVELKFIASNKDLPEASLWVKLAASFEANTVLWIIIICAAVLVLVILIIIIAVIRKRKREREEIEALLVSEMEIEEQMLRLAGGPSPTDYQSYGYLPGGPAPQADPSMMLGAGADAPQQELTALPPAQDTPTDGNGGTDEAM